MDRATMAKAAEDGVLVDLGYPRGIEIGAGLRAQKYIRPVCDSIVENGVVVFEGCRNTPRWSAGECPHDPYASEVTFTETVPELSEPDETGRRTVLGTKQIVRTERRFNIAQVPFSVRINSGRGPEYFKGLGWKDPVEMGLKPFCEMVNCYSQDIKHRTVSGNYCSEEHAKLIIADENEDKLEILDAKKRSRQLAQVAV